MPQTHIGGEFANFLSRFMFSSRLYSFRTLVIQYLRHASVTVRFVTLLKRKGGRDIAGLSKWK